MKEISASIGRNIILCLLLLLVGDCSEDVTTPLGQVVISDTMRSDYVINKISIGAPGSIARDICIISDTSVWFVGRFFGPDSMGAIDYINTYNSVAWNGSAIRFHRLPAVSQSGTIGRAALRCVSKISADNIWMFSDAGSYLHWDGKSWTSEWIKARQGSILRSVVLKDQIVLIGGTSASISRGYGSVFVLDQNPIERRYAIQDFAVPSSTSSDVFAVAADESFCKSIVVKWNGVKKIWEEYQISIPGASTLSLDEMVLTSICSTNDSTLLICGGRCPSTFFVLRINIYEPRLNAVAAWLPSRPNVIRSTAKNNVFVGGENGMIYHFNGRTWRCLQREKMSSTTITALTVIQNSFLACGYSSESALVLKGQLLMK